MFLSRSDFSNVASLCVVSLLTISVSFAQEGKEVEAEKNLPARQSVPVLEDRQFVLNDIDVLLKNGDKVTLLAGTAIEPVDKVGENADPNQIRIQVLGEEHTFPREQFMSRKQAEGHFRIRAVAPFPKSMRPWGRFLLEEERYREASAVWNKIANRSAAPPGDLYPWAMSCIQSQQWEAALEPLGKLLEFKETLQTESLPLVGVSWHDLQGLRGLCQLRNKRPKLAIRDLQAVVQEQPETLSFRLLLFETYLSLNRYEEALDLERQIDQLSDADSSIQNRLDQLVWNLCKVIVNDLDSSQKSRMEGSKFHLLLSGRTPGHVQQAEMGVRSLIAVKQYLSADKLLNRARRKYPESSELIFLNGLSAAIQGDFRRAIIAFDQLVERSPDDHTPYRHRANIHIQNRDYQQALNDLRHVVRIDPEHVDGWYQSAVCLLRMGQPAEAITVLEMVTEIHPDYYQPWNLLGWTYATYPDDTIRNSKSAVMCTLRANELTGFGNATYLDSLAAAYAEAGLFEDAISTQIDAIDKLPTSPDRAGFLERLERYRQSEPFREDPRHGDF